MVQSNQGLAARSWTTKQLVWSSVVSLAIGAIVTYQAGFNWRLAVSACVQEFLLKPDRGVTYAALKGMTSSFQRRQLVQDQKLAANFDVADACGEQIRELDETLFPAT